ncbi:hypothetical protein ES703_117563 [subsurface metagenome]
MKIDKKVHLSEEGAGIMTIVIKRPHAHLKKQAAKRF